MQGVNVAMVEVFCTNVHEPEAAALLIVKLQLLLPDASFHFDLEDCDRILRVETEPGSVPLIVHELNANGYSCTPL
jgi:hypothetical protein